MSELRSLVEPQIAGLAALRATEADLLSLEQTLNAQHAGLSASESQAVDLRFHTQLARASGNPLLVALVTSTNHWTAGVRRRSHVTRAGRRASVDGHRAIVRAVAGRDQAAAIAAMTAHLADVARLVARLSGSATAVTTR